MERNAVSIPELKWQYIGFEQNYVINYPATRINWPNYDPRLRYIYVHIHVSCHCTTIGVVFSV